MSTSSPRRSPLPAENGPPAEFQPFPYDTVSLSGSGVSRPFASAREPMESVADEGAALAARARSEGREQGLAESKELFVQRLDEARASLAAALEQFSRDRARYFQRVEAEVVQLAMSIARKILHREAQLDPLLLAAIVRVALEKIDGATAVTLRLHPQNAADWRRYLTTHLAPADVPEIVEDPSEAIDQCVLETSLGTASICIEGQLKEIEQGFMDLLAVRPGAGS